MADIDKALPNEVRKTVNVPGEEEIQEEIVEEVQAVQESPEDIEVYFCGPPLMNVAVQKMGEDFGIPDDSIRFDDFGG